LIRNYEKVGFQTPSKKVELYSETFKKFGYDPLPNYVEPGESPISRPDLVKDYPLICNTGKKPAVWTHTQYRNLSLLNRIDSDPIVEIHPDKAKELDINHGDEVIVESLRGIIRLKACLTEVTDPRVVFITHGWGQPYAKGPIINRLTDSSERCPISSATETDLFV
jgi:anaerobic selenocysteine-containing dehydrogenase